MGRGGVAEKLKTADVAKEEISLTNLYQMSLRIPKVTTSIGVMVLDQAKITRTPNRYQISVIMKRFLG